MGSHHIAGKHVYRGVSEDLDRRMHLQREGITLADRLAHPV
ncbi:hypothetical protein FB565_000205 [Actinoplanes lutulentus]|nr:hypothetical protein [Actinoplanes lutulentus]MBB2940501.1 hypothetical protein [Actinoplanes lutulentus]